MLDILHHAYDLTPCKLAIATPVKKQPFPNRVSPWEEVADKGLVDDERHRSAAPVALGETAARRQLDAHDLEIIRADPTSSGLENLARGGRPPSGKYEPACIFITAERKWTGSSGRSHTWRCLEPLNHLLEESGLLRFGVLGERQPDLQCQDVLWVEARVYAEKAHEAADH